MRRQTSLIRKFEKATYFILFLIVFICSNLNAISRDNEITSIYYPSSCLNLPPAYGPSEGQLYLENIQLGFFGIECAFKNFINVIAFDGAYINIPPTLVTLAGLNKNLSIGYRRIFYNFFSVQEQYDGTSFVGNMDLINKWSIITVNRILMNEPPRSFANRFNFHSPALYRNIKNVYNIDFGLTYFSAAEELGRYPCPYVKYRADTNELFPYLNPSTLKIRTSKPLIESKEVNEKKKVFYVEFGGLGYLYSLNYDVRLLNSLSGGGIGIRIGAGSYGATYFPLQVNYLVGGKEHFLELASGITLATSNFDPSYGPYGSFNVSPSSSIAYRFQPFNKGFFLRVSVDVFYDLAISEDGFQPWIGFGMGHSFR